MRLGGAPFPYKEEFRALGIGIRLAATNGTGPLLQARLAKGHVLLSRLHGVQGTAKRRAQVVAGLVLAAGAYGVEVAPVSGTDLRRMDAAVMRGV